jgi:hypothetical protein
MELLAVELVFDIGACANAGTARTAAKAAAVKVRFVMKVPPGRAAFARPLKRKRGT